MSDHLKKEFNSRDVQRMRNIITGQTGDRTQIQTGWEKNGKKWTIKKGIKQSVTKLDEIKKLVVLPISCPSCGKMMKVDMYNKKMWAIHQKCFDCVIKMESEIKRQGKWEEYSRNVMNLNKNAELNDLEQALEQWATEKDTFVSEAGEVEKWGGGDKTAIYKQVKEEIAKLKERDIYNGENTQIDVTNSEENKD
jgi:hypothetical protein